MKKIYFFLLAICLMGAACKDDEESSRRSSNEKQRSLEKSADEKEKSLKDTKWKLTGIMDMNTGILQELEPKDCEQCYTLTFDTDSTSTVLSLWAMYKLNLLQLNLYRNLCCPENSSDYGFPCGPWGGACLDAESKDGISYEDSYLFRRGIENVKSYEWADNELRLFFVALENNYYLLFNPFK